MSVAVAGDPARSLPTAEPTFERIPPEDFFELVEVFLLLLDLEVEDEALFVLFFGVEPADLLDALVLAPPADLAVFEDCFAPPEEVLFPAPPLFVAVDVFDPPEVEERVAFAAVFFEAADLDLVSEVEAPVLEEDDDFPLLLFTELPVFAVADLDSLPAFPEAVAFFVVAFLAVEALLVLCVFGILYLL